MKEDHTRIILPAIDNIKYNTFEVQQYANAAHGYNWGLWCMYIIPPQEWLDKGDETAPIRWGAGAQASIIDEHVWWNMDSPGIWLIHARSHHQPSGGAPPQRANKVTPVDRRLISMMNIYLVEAGIARPCWGWAGHCVTQLLVGGWRYLAPCRCIIPELRMFMLGQIVLDFNWLRRSRGGLCCMDVVLFVSQHLFWFRASHCNSWIYYLRFFTLAKDETNKTKIMCRMTTYNMRKIRCSACDRLLNDLTLHRVILGLADLSGWNMSLHIRSRRKLMKWGCVVLSHRSGITKIKNPSRFTSKR